MYRVPQGKAVILNKTPKNFVKIAKILNYFSLDIFIQDVWRKCSLALLQNKLIVKNGQESSLTTNGAFQNEVRLFI